MQILIRMQNGEGCRFTRDGKTTVAQITRATTKELGIKGRYTLRSSEGILNPRHSIARAGGTDPDYVERVWKLEPVPKKSRKTAQRRKR